MTRQSVTDAAQRTGTPAGCHLRVVGAALLAALAVVLVPHSTAEAGLLGYWPFEEGAGGATADVTGQNPAGGVIGSTAWSTNTPSMLNSTSTRAIDIQGDLGTGLVDLGNVVGLDAASDFSLSMWFTMDSIPGSFPGLISKRSAFSGFDWELFIRSSGSNGLEFAAGGTFTGSIVSPTPPTPAPDWHHLALTKAGTSYSLYLDGGPPVVSTITSPIDGGDTVAVGVLQGTPSPSNSWDGLTDDVGIFDRALTAAEVLAIANLPAIGTGLDLIDVTAIIDQHQLGSGSVALDNGQTWKFVADASLFAGRNEGDVFEATLSGVPVTAVLLDGTLRTGMVFAVPEPSTLSLLALVTVPAIRRLRRRVRDRR